MDVVRAEEELRHDRRFAERYNLSIKGYIVSIRDCIRAADAKMHIPTHADEHLYPPRDRIGPSWDEKVFFDAFSFAMVDGVKEMAHLKYSSASG